MRHLTLCILLLTTMGYAHPQSPLEALPHFPPDMMDESRPIEAPKPQRKKRVPVRILCQADRAYAHRNTCKDDGQSIVCTYSHAGPKPHQLTVYFSMSIYTLR